MPKSYSLDESFSLSGTWWVPSSPELGQEQGVLSFEPGAIISLKLEEFSALSDKPFRGIGRFAQEGHQLIKGITKTGESMLLFENRTFAFNQFFPHFVLFQKKKPIIGSETARA